VRELTPDDIALVESVARRMASRSRLPWEELQSLGWLGLLRAAQRFDPSRGVPFEIWAETKIRGEIKDKLRKEYGSKQIGTRSRMQWHPEFIGDTELDAFVRNSTSDIAALENRDLCEWLLAPLKPKYQRAFYLRFYEGLEEQEIAGYMGLTESRVSQMLARGRKSMGMRAKVEFRHHMPVPVDEPLLAM